MLLFSHNRVGLLLALEGVQGLNLVKKKMFEGTAEARHAAWVAAFQAMDKFEIYFAGDDGHVQQTPHIYHSYLHLTVKEVDEESGQDVLKEIVWHRNPNYRCNNPTLEWLKTETVVGLEMDFQETKIMRAVDIRQPGSPTPDCMVDWKLPQGLTIKDFINDTGLNKPWEIGDYDAKRNNCQHFLQEVLDKFVNKHFFTSKDRTTLLDKKKVETGKSILSFCRECLFQTQLEFREMWLAYIPEKLAEWNQNLCEITNSLKSEIETGEVWTAYNRNPLCEARLKAPKGEREPEQTERIPDRCGIADLVGHGKDYFICKDTAVVQKVSVRFGRQKNPEELVFDRLDAKTYAVGLTPELVLENYNKRAENFRETSMHS